MQQLALAILCMASPGLIYLTAESLHLRPPAPNLPHPPLLLATTNLTSFSELLLFFKDSTYKWDRTAFVFLCILFLILCFHFLAVFHLWGLPGGSEGKKICLPCGRPGFDPWVVKIPWRREWLPTPVFLPGELHGQGSLVGYLPWGHKEEDTTERLTLSIHVMRAVSALIRNSTLVPCIGSMKSYPLDHQGSPFVCILSLFNWHLNFPWFGPCEYCSQLSHAAYLDYLYFLITVFLRAEQQWRRPPPHSKAAGSHAPSPHYRVGWPQGRCLTPLGLSSSLMRPTSQDCPKDGVSYSIWEA